MANYVAGLEQSLLFCWNDTTDSFSLVWSDAIYFHGLHSTHTAGVYEMLIRGFTSEKGRVQVRYRRREHPTRQTLPPDYLY